MISYRRVSLIYLKELVDILRDRRALAAMVIVPIVLYPLLMVGSVQAISVASSELRRQIVIGVDPTHHASFHELYHEHETHAALQPPSSLPDPPDEAPEERPEVLLREVRTDEMAQAVRDRLVHLGMVFRSLPSGDPLTSQYEIELIYDPELPRGRSAFDWLSDVLRDVARHRVEFRMSVLNVPIESLEPILLVERRITTPGSVLSLILPLILVLMTITGAIYPAIDLTAGERERGTLETLMVSPVPVMELIVGKFLVVTTVAVVGAALNLACVSATVYFGGFEQALSGREQSGGFPFGVLPVILLSLVPFAILFSAVLIAVCSFARTFKEAQNYITPVILAALIPGGIAALPTSELQGVLAVTPVANMVLLTRELLLGSPVPAGMIARVLISTTLYAAAAVAVAARIYGTESVVFSDSGSIRASFARRLIRPTERPSAALVTLVAALLFPLWYFVQVRLQSAGGAGVLDTLRLSAAALPICFVLLPLGVLWYWKANPAATLQISAPRPRHVLAAVLLGLALWVPVAEWTVLQGRLVGMAPGLAEQNRELMAVLNAAPIWHVVLYLGIVPGLCEELFFRGALLSGLRGSMRKWTAIVVTALVFAVFHFVFFHVPTKAVLGIVLGWLCWQSRSIWPAVLAHVLHNSVVALLPRVGDRLGMDLAELSTPAHLPIHILAPGLVIVAAGVLLARRPASRQAPG